MGFERLLKACFRSEKDEDRAGINSVFRPQPQKSIGIAALVERQPPSGVCAISEWISTTGGDSCTGRECSGSEAKTHRPVSAPGRAAAAVRRLATQNLIGHSAKMHADSPGDSTVTRSSTAAAAGIDSHRCDMVSSQYLLDDGDLGVRASLSRPSASREPRSAPQQAPPCLTVLHAGSAAAGAHQHNRQTQQPQQSQQQQLPACPELVNHGEQRCGQLQQQVFVANLGLEPAAAGATSATTTNITPLTSCALLSPAATTIITTTASTRETPHVATISSQDGLASFPLPPVPPQPPVAMTPPPLPSRRKLRPPGRSPTSPSGANSDSLPLLQPAAHSAPAGDGASAPLLTSAAGRRSSGTEDLRLATSTGVGAVPVGVLFSSFGAGGSGQGIGSTGRTLSDMPGLDLRAASQHLAVLAESELYGAATAAVASMPSARNAGSDSCSASTAAAAAAAAASAMERELGLIRVSSLEELSKQLEGLRWLASGNSGRVFTGLWKGSPVAVKVVLSATPDQLRDSAREALLSRVVSHPAICQCYTVCSDCIAAEHLQLPARGSPHNAAASAGRIMASSSLPCALPSPSASTLPDIFGAGIGGSSSRGAPASLSHLGISLAPASSPAAAAAATAAVDGEGGVAVRLCESPRGARLQEDLGEAEGTLRTAANTAPPPPPAGTASQASWGPSGDLDPQQQQQGECAPEISSPGRVALLSRRCSANSISSVGSAAVALARGTPDCATGADASPRSRDGTAAAAAAASCDGLSGGGVAHMSSPGRVKARQQPGALAQHTPQSATSEPAQLILPVKRGVTARREGCKSDTGPAAGMPAAGGLCSVDISAHEGISTSSSGGGAVAGPGACPVSSSGTCGNATSRSSMLTPRRCLGLPAAAAELNTTLSLSELLRSYPPADDDNSFMMQSLPAVLLSMGAAPGRYCTIVVLEWCNQGTLLEAIRSRPFTPERSPYNHQGLLILLRTALEIAQGMRYLHSLDIVHGDLKPSNVLLQSRAGHLTGSTGIWAEDSRGYVAKVADFGLAKPASQGSTGTVMGVGAGGEGDGPWGALAYMAPEVPDSGPSKKSDVYSYGCVLYHMCTGKQPFQGIRQGRLLAGLATGALVLQWPDNIYKVLRRLGEACCAPKPKDRPSFDKVVDALQKTITYVARSPSPSRSSRAGLDSMSSWTSTDRDASTAATSAAAAWRMALIGRLQPREASVPPQP